MSTKTKPDSSGPDGVIAVDARIAIRRPPPSQGRYEHMPITPYPRHLEQHEFLADGTPLIIRPIRPEDAENEQSFVRELSDEARHFRFLYALHELPPDMLARFTQLDYSREMALVAFTMEAGRPVQQGVARYVINPDGTSCEFAVVVSDKRQHQGIGTRLMKALIDAARDHRLTVMEGKVLANNRSMLQLMSELGFTTERSEDEPDIRLVQRRL